VETPDSRRSVRFRGPPLEIYSVYFNGELRNLPEATYSVLCTPSLADGGHCSISHSRAVFRPAHALDSPSRKPNPLQSVQKFGGTDFQRTCELDEGVNAGHPFATLKHSNLGPVDRSTDAKLFLGELGPPAAVGEVGPELSRYVAHGSSSRSK